MTEPQDIQTPKDKEDTSSTRSLSSNVDIEEAAASQVQFNLDVDESSVYSITFLKEGERPPTPIVKTNTVFLTGYMEFLPDTKPPPLKRLFIAGWVLSSIGCIMLAVAMSTPHWSVATFTVTPVPGQRFPDLYGFPGLYGFEGANRAHGSNRRMSMSPSEPLTIQMFYGAWRTCISDIVLGCVDVSVLDDVVKPWRIAASVMFVLSVMFSVGAVFTSVLCILSDIDKVRDITHGFSVGFALLGMLSSVMGIFVWTLVVHDGIEADIQSYFKSKGNTVGEIEMEYGYSVAVSIASAAFLMMSAWFYIFGYRTCNKTCMSNSCSLN